VTIPIRQGGGAAATWLIAVLVAAALCILPAGAPAAETRVAHRIEVELDPAAQMLLGRDRMQIETGGREHLVIALSALATRVRVELNGAACRFEFRQGRIVVPLPPGAREGPVELTLSWAARFDDPVPIQPLNTDNPGFGVSGSITAAGTFLLPGAGWYPDLEDARATFHLSVKAPPGVIAVTAGRSLGHESRDGFTVSTWRVDHPVRGLALSAAAYEVRERAVGEIVAATYFLPGNRDLAPEYLDAVARYLDLHARRFGPYPFPKFAVVENFFPTGYGFPSYTLLGGSILRLPFIIGTSLGHEIAHCWWGNGVLVDYASGNWSEALTTYVSDYGSKEQASEEEAREFRLQALRNYAALVPGEKETPLSRFLSRTDPVSKAIGYDKGFMVFHMLRRNIGEDAFWGALRDVQREFLFRPASWHDLRAAFERRAHRPLKGFFDQWVFRPGAPRLGLADVRSERTGEGWQVSGRVLQEPPAFDLALDLALESGGPATSHALALSGASAAFRLTGPAPPRRLAIDPEAHVFRRLDPLEIPPSVNSLKGSDFVLIAVAPGLDARGGVLADILARSLGLKHHTVIPAAELDSHPGAARDLLLIGPPDRPGLLVHAPDGLRLGEIDPGAGDRAVLRADLAFFGVFAHPRSAGRVVALYLPPPGPQAEAVAAKITHYGRFGYLVFEDGQNREKKVLPPEHSPVVHLWR
jgi:hypothetical protein